MNVSNIIYSSDLSTLRQLSEQAKENRYSISNIDSRKKETGDLHYFVDIVFSVPLDPRLILFDKFRMLELADEYGAEYGGWGSVVNNRPVRGCAARTPSVIERGISTLPLALMTKFVTD